MQAKAAKVCRIWNLTKEVFVWPQGHMKTMLYGNPRACVHILLEFNPRYLCN